MTILDTNVISALMNDPPEEAVVRWLDRQTRSSLWTTSITVLEIQAGLKVIPAGASQAKLSEVFDRILVMLDHRVAVFGETAARLSAELNASRRQQGRVMELRDTMIAGLVIAHHARLATRNVSHFADIGETVVNPWAA